MPLRAKQQSPNAAGFLLFCRTPAGPRLLVLLNKWGSRTWGFPKGHVDKADRGDYLVTALRETREETGFGEQEIRAGERLGSVLYTMPRPTRNVPSGVKHVAFFAAEIPPVASGAPPQPTLSKEHTAAEWVSVEEAAARVDLAHTGVLSKLKELLIIN